MDKRFAILFGAFVLGAVVLWWVVSQFTLEAPQQAPTSAPEQAPVAETAPDPLTKSTHAPQSAVTPHAAPKARTAAVRRGPTPTATTDGTTLRLRVLDAATGEPVTRYEAVVDDLPFVSALTRPELQLFALFLGTSTEADVGFSKVNHQDGATRLSAIPNQSLAVFVHADGYVPAGEVLTPLAESETREMQVRLDPGTLANVAVANVAGESLAGAYVMLNVTDTGLAKYVRDEEQTGPETLLPLGQTSETGNVALRLPANVPLQLTADHVNHRRETKLVQLAASDSEQVSIVLHAPGAITGVVTANGRPVGGAMVMARLRGGDRIEARRRGWRDGSDRADDDDGWRGRTERDDDKNGRRGRTERDTDDERFEGWRGRGGASAPQDGFGPGIEDGPADGRRRQRREPSDLEAPEGQQGNEQRRAEAGEAGENNGPRRYDVDASSRGRDGRRGNRAETNEDGVYRIEGLDDGEYEVSTMTFSEDAGFAGGQRLTRYAVVAQDMDTQLDFALPTESSAITGTITVNGEPAAMGFVRGVVRFEDGQQPFVIRVDESGRYEAAVPPGEAELQIFARPTGSRSAATTRLTVTIPPRSTVRQDVELAR